MVPFLKWVSSNHVLFLAIWFILALPCKASLTKRSIYIVHMDKSLMPLAFSSHQSWYSSIITSLSYASSSLEEDDDLPPPSLFIYTYNNVIHGFSAFLSLSELEYLRKFQGFVTAQNDVKFTYHTTYTPEFLKLNHLNGLWPISNYGKDVIVGVIDTGLLPESLCFNDIGMAANVPTKWNGTCEEAGEDFNTSLCNNKIIGARYFNKGLKKEVSGKMEIKDSARDFDGHGTLVSSIAAGNYVNGVSFFGYGKGTAKGTAPNARLAVYKVMWKEGIYSSDVLAGVDQAIEDGVDVINMSFGNPKISSPGESRFPLLHENSLAIASFSAMEKGIVVVCSAGNEGPQFKNVDNGFPWVLTVAASTTNRWFVGVLTLGNGINITGWSLFHGNTSLQNLPLVFNIELSRCDSEDLLSKAISGTIIICDDIGDVSQQLLTLTKANVTAAILISKYPTSLEFTYFLCPCIVISSKETNIVISYAKYHSNPFASLIFQLTIIGKNDFSPAVAWYSSRGPSRTYKHILKPDVMAPGSFILGSWHPKNNILGDEIEANFPHLYHDYIIESGTSLACPHVTGIVALLKARYPNWSPAAIRSAIITTANPVDNTGMPIRDNGHGLQFASPLAMGAGHIDPNQAIDPGLIYDATVQDYVDLLCSLNLTKEEFSSVTRSSAYNCSNPSGDLNYPSFIAFYSDISSLIVQKFVRVVTNVGEDVAIYYVMVIPPLGCEVEVSPKKLEFRRKYEKQSYSVVIRYKGKKSRESSSGEIVWIATNGKHKVRSPIMVAPGFQF